jgi:hypothetical protein
LLESRKSNAEPDMCVEALRRLAQHLMQGWACNAEIRWQVRTGKGQTADLSEELPVAIAKTDVVKGKSGGDTRLCNAQRRQRAECVALHSEADVIDLPIGIDFDQLDFDAGATERNGARQASDAAPDDQHLFHPAHSSANVALAQRGGEITFPVAGD